MKHLSEADSLNYYALSLLKVMRNGTRRNQLAIFGIWCFLLVVCISLGLATVVKQWSGLPLNVGDEVVYITIYPPLIICLMLTLCWGWWWGAIPAYFATLSLALYAGMPLDWAALFACANPLGFAIIAIGYRAISTRRDLRSFSSTFFFIQLSFVASVFSSSGALLWSYINQIDKTEVFAIWQGWWLGAFLQSVLIGAPLMALFWPRIERWHSKHPQLLDEANLDGRRPLLWLFGSVSLVVLIYGYLTISLAGNQVDLALQDETSPLGKATSVMHQTMWISYWVLALMIVFITFFGHYLFKRWQKSTGELMQELHAANLRLKALAHTDGLTGLANRRAMEESLNTEWHRARRFVHSSALVMLDIDHFKEINDRYGHLAGDEALRSLAATIKQTARSIDMAGRFGGEEFLVVLPQVTVDGAWAFAERLREQVGAKTIYYEGGEFHCQISLGIAMFDVNDRQPEDWIRRADEAVYSAKHAGRNNTYCFWEGHQLRTQS